MSGLPLRPCRGQNLHLQNRAGLETPLICGKYIVPAGEGGDLLLCGATFEYDPEGLREPPSEAEAAAALLAPLEEMLPSIRDAPIVRCRDSQPGTAALPCRVPTPSSAECAGATPESAPSLPARTSGTCLSSASCRSRCEVRGEGTAAAAARSEAVTAPPGCLAGSARAA
mmetsp:Transcript_46353/g.154679  ORF Transcript_46353/g.154679 Transcript_46353/m.154679 type:complete len:170 (-) Transcript_46353:221-730(-)